MAVRANLSQVPYWAAGPGAGIVSALFFLTAATGSPLFGLFLYIAPLPVFFAGLGWGAVAAGIAALTGMVLLSFLNSFTAGLVFFVLDGAIPFWLVRQALLYRPTAPKPAQRRGRGEADAKAMPVEWYPTGRLVIWCAGIAVTFFIMATVGVSLAGYKGGVADALREMLIEAAVETGTLDALLEAFGIVASPDTILSVVTIALPAAAGTLWILLTLGNMWLAQAVLQVQGINLRPTPQLGAMEVPLWYMGAFAAAIALSLIPGETAYFGGTVAVILAVPYFLLGLGVIHAISRPWIARTVFLGVFYVLLAVFNWLAIPVWLLGLVESGVGVRGRLASTSWAVPWSRKSKENE